MISNQGIVTAQQLLPGWYWDPYYGWYYLDAEGNKWLGNPNTGMLYRPLALTTVDEKTWDAFSVQAPVVDGKIINCCLDVDGTLYWQDDFPVDVAIGAEVRVHFTYMNTGDEAAQFYYSIEILDPDGEQRAFAEGNNPCDPGWQKGSARTDYITIDKGGIWVVHGILWVL